MLDREEYGELYSTLKAYITKLTCSSVFYSKESYRDSIGNAVKETTPLFYFLAAQAGDLEEAKDLLDKFSSLFFIALPKVQEYRFEGKEFNEIKDEINYLRVCVNNICKVDLNEVKDFELKSRETTKKIVEDKYTQTPSSLAAYRHALNINITTDPEKEFGDFLLKSHAHERLYQDIVNGSIYIYLTKPKVNVYVKYLLLLISAAGIFVSLAAMFLLFKELPVNFKTLSFPIGFSCCCVSAIWFVSSVIQIKNSFKNDNFKYSFKEVFTGRSVILPIVVVICSVTSQFPAITGGLAASLVSSAVLIAILTAAISLLSLVFLQPKKNQQLIDDVIANHISDISKETSL